MNSEDKLRLQVNHKLLVDTLELNDIRDAFIDHAIFDADLMAKVAKEEEGRGQIRRLLRELPRGGPQAYHVFYQSMEDAECYAHVLEALDATDLIEAEKTRNGQNNCDSQTTEEGVLRLKANYKLLVSQIRYCDIRDKLYQDAILNDNTLEEMDILDSSKTENEKMQRLLKIVMSRASGYTSFRSALLDHEAYKHIVKELDSTDLESAREKYGGVMRKTDTKSKSAPKSSAVDMKAVFMAVSDDGDCLRNWKRFRLLPGIDEADMFCIQSSYKDDGPRECLYQLLCCWQQKQGRDASVDALCTVLDELTLRRTKGKIEEKYS